MKASVYVEFYGEQVSQDELVAAAKKKPYKELVSTVI